MWLPWQWAAVFAVILGAAGLASRRAEHRVVVAAGAFEREAALVFVLYAIWQAASDVTFLAVDGAMAKGRAIWDVEQATGFMSEAWLQQRILPYPWLVQAANVYYGGAHVPVTIAFLVWVFVRHRDRYPPIRNVLALVTGACLVIRFIPVAPPRLFPDLGFVDTAALYHQSVYGPMGTGVSSQLAAMPSIHVAWAALVGAGAVLLTTSRWRWWALGHTVVTALVVVVTANHWWLDGAVAVAFFLPAIAIQRLIERTQARWASPPPRELVAAHGAADGDTAPAAPGRAGSLAD
jgi:hypothetical protein